MGKLIRRLMIGALVLSAACTTSQQTVPPLAGPSEFALSLKVTATPDSISRDGASQSAIAVNAFDANGKGISGLPLRIDMAVDGTVVDFGTLSARTIVTNTNGQAITVYTAPSPSALDGGFGSVVTIIATPTSNNFETVTPQIVTIRLVPPGVILPPAGTPTAEFTFTPQPVTVNVPATFDASTSKPGTGASSISLYSWDFGDGGTATGRTVSHTFTSQATFNVTLTVTNNRGLVASSLQAVATSAPAPFTGVPSFSPGDPVPGTIVQFNATTVKAAAFRTIVDYSWDFGDSGSSSNLASGPIVTHQFNALFTYNVVLTVRDDLNQKTTFTLSVTVKKPTP